MLLATFLTAASAYTVAPIAHRPFTARHASPCMGGFEQKFYNKEGARLALLVSDAPGLSLADVPKVCTADGVSGIVYGLSGGRVEVIAEGTRESLVALAGAISAAAGAGATLREAWQAPVGGYKDSFPVVELAPKMSAEITMSSDPEDLDYVRERTASNGLLSTLAPAPAVSALALSLAA